MDNKTQQPNEHTAKSTCLYYVNICSWQSQWECREGQMELAMGRGSDFQR